MRICLVTGEYPALGSHGGIGTYTQNLAAGLAAHGHDVTVLARGLPGAAPFAEGAVTVVPVPTAPRWALPAGNRHAGMTLRALPFVWAAGRAYARLEAARRFDVVEVPEYQGWGLGVAARTRAPVVVRLHSHTALVRRLNGVPLDADTRMITALEAASVRRGDLVLSNSRALVAEMASDLGVEAARVGVLPLGVDTERFAPGDGQALRARLGLGPEASLLLYVGRLERRKGVEPLIEAFGRLRLSHPEAHLALAGFSTDTGPNQASLLRHLRGRVGALGAGAHVHFLGHVPYEQLPAYYAAADVFVAPSLYEPFGMIYLEAMACGRVAVGCAAGGVSEIIEDGATGLLVPPGDAEALAARLAAVLERPAWRAGIEAAARQAVLARFSLPVLAERTAAHYAAAVAARRAGRPAWKEATHVPHA